MSTKPNLVQQAQSLVIAQVQNIGLKLLSPEQIKRRYDICAGTEDTPKCPFFTGHICASCLCRVNLKRSRTNKISLPRMECPEKKWGCEDAE